MDALKLSYQQKEGLGEIIPLKNLVYCFPFGMLLPNRNGDAGSDYRYGFNGMEKDDEVTEQKGTSYDFGARFYNPRVKKWLSIDPHAEKYPAQSPYTFNLNSPVLYDDPNGMDARITITKETNAESGENQTVITISSKIYLTGKALTASEQASLDSYKDRVFDKDYTSSDGTTIVRFDVEYVKASSPSPKLPKPINKLLNEGPTNSLSEIAIKAKTNQPNDTGPSDQLNQGDNYATFNPTTIGKSVAYPRASKMTIDKYSNPDQMGFAIIHESLHLLGLSDHYFLNKEGGLEDYNMDAIGTPMGLYLDPADDPLGFFDGRMELTQSQVDNIVKGVNKGVENKKITEIPSIYGPKTYGLFKFLNSGNKLDDTDSQLQENKEKLGTPDGPAK